MRIRGNTEANLTSTALGLAAGKRLSQADLLFGWGSGHPACRGGQALEPFNRSHHIRIDCEFLFAAGYSKDIAAFLAAESPP